jgi:putative oxidoreductase
MSKFLEALDRQRTWAPLLLRLAIGATFVVHGYPKVFGGDLPGTAARLAGAVGLPTAFGYAAAFGEFAGGVGLLLGCFTRLSALAIAGVMAGAIYMHAVKLGQPFKMGVADKAVTGWEWQALIVAGCLTLVLLGGGAISLDALCRRFCRPKEPGPPPAT